MSGRRPWGAGACALVALAACGGGDGLEIRAGVSTVLAGPLLDLTQSFGDPAVAIQDVDHDGDRVAVVLVGGNSVTIILSEDGGTTWAEHPIDADFLQGLGWDQGPMGVDLHGGEIDLLYTVDRIGANDVVYVDLVSARVDQTTWTVTAFPDQAMADGEPSKRDDGHVRVMSLDGDFRTGTGYPRFEEIDPSTGTITMDNALTCTDAACNTPELWTSPDRGDTWATFAQTATDMCLLSAGISGDTTVTCTPLALWPGRFATAEVPMLYAAGVPEMVWSTGDQTYATAMSASGPVTTPLGTGVIGVRDYLGRFLRPRLGGFQLADEPNPPTTRAAQGRLLSLDNGPQEVTFRATPCVDDDNCGYLGTALFGYRLVQWIEPMSDGSDLVFWAVESQSDPLHSQQTLYAEREMPTRTPASGGCTSYGFEGICH